MIVSLTLIIAAILIGIESIHLIQTPHPLPHAYTLWVLLTVVGVKVLLSRYVSSVGEGIDSTAVRSDAWHHVSDAITSAFVFVGISIALWTAIGNRKLRRSSLKTGISVTCCPSTRSPRNLLKS